MQACQVPLQAGPSDPIHVQAALGHTLLILQGCFYLAIAIMLVE